MKLKVYWIFLFVLLSAAACKKGEAPQKTSSGNEEKDDSTNPKVHTIQFSGYTWKVKHTESSTMGPGPNYWNQQNVWVDSNGWLHLKLRWNASGKRWECAEVISIQSFGYGTYQWQIDGPLNALDRNVVLGLFNYNGVDGLHEMDIEFARWGVQSNQPLNYTVYPASSNQATFTTSRDFTLEGTFTTHRFIRLANSVHFKSMGGFYDDDTNIFASAICQAPYTVSTISMPVYMNLWLFRGAPPSDNADVEIVIRNFKFTP